MEFFKKHSGMECGNWRGPYGQELALRSPRRRKFLWALRESRNAAADSYTAVGRMRCCWILYSRAR